jgi:hypothetical protein
MNAACFTKKSVILNALCYQSDFAEYRTSRFSMYELKITESKYMGVIKSREVIADVSSYQSPRLMLLLTEAEISVFCLQRQSTSRVQTKYRQSTDRVQTVYASRSTKYILLCDHHISVTVRYASDSRATCHVFFEHSQKKKSDNHSS